MIVEVIHPETKKVVKIDIENFNINQLEDFEPVTEKKTLINFIDNLAVPAEAKALLGKVIESTIKVGEKIIYIGRKIIELIMLFMKKYPSTTLGKRKRRGDVVCAGLNLNSSFRNSASFLNQVSCRCHFLFEKLYWPLIS